MRTRRTKSSESIVVLLAVFATSAGRAVEPNSIDITIDDPRPVSRAVDELRKINPYPVSYEDPPYLYSEDLRDVTPQVAITKSKGRILVPAGGTLELHLPAQSRAAGTGTERQSSLAKQALQQIITGDKQRGIGGQFAIDEVGGMLHVVPASSRNAEGEWIERSSILRHRISIRPDERTAIEMLNEICSALSDSTGNKVGLASGPLRTLYASRSVQGANNEIARDVLIRTLQRAGGHMTWKLLFAPDFGGYALNIEPLPRIPARATLPTQSQEQGGKKFGEK